MMPEKSGNSVQWISIPSTLLRLLSCVRRDDGRDEQTSRAMVHGGGGRQAAARLNCIAHLLSLIPHENVLRKRIRLPKRQKPSGYREPARNYKYVADTY
jgi:hypothetical protein